ncbi:MAG: T9SS type A sorting domain-containing protein [Xanthomarina gelatinilytica]|uniref:T9SS type A sorting domain-containing protein n=1 Tax=Xanthomarina gelatinilytica TaxID=1137281 RepID=UPI003A8C720A
MLNTSTWTIGTGSVTGFVKYGLDSENIREYGKNHIGEQVILWKASPTTDGNASGGWDTSLLPINSSNTYRLSVWIKKVNSNDGGTFFGPGTNSGGAQHTLKLDGTSIDNPYFWNGDLPKLDRWYLLVGYVHKSSYNATLSLGRIYDGVTGGEVLNITDYKFKNTAVNLKHRAYLWADSNPSDSQYYYAPRIELIDGTEWTLNELLNIHPDSELVFNYDNAGNQTGWFYALPGWYKVAPSDDKGNLYSEIIQEVIPEEESKLLSRNITLYPNPTKGIVSLKLNSGLKATFSNTINVYNSMGVRVLTIPSESNNKININLSGLSDGMYLINVSLSDGTNVAKQIIKN